MDDWKIAIVPIVSDGNDGIYNDDGARANEVLDLRGSRPPHVIADTESLSMGYVLAGIA
jgi:hypothetical protein